MGDSNERPVTYRVVHFSVSEFGESLRISRHYVFSAEVMLLDRNGDPCLSKGRTHAFNSTQRDWEGTKLDWFSHCVGAMDADIHKTIRDWNKENSDG